ncbi:hypothetical protein CBS101457_004209 [Exobasidium rhododendri]|nr:hypothetical protein CBS101457_004209 [Exobasidium rhododendri]
MDTIRTSLGNSLGWLQSQSSRFNSSLLFDSLSIPFTDSQSGLSASSSGRSHGSPEERVVYLDASGRELSQGELDEYAHSAFNDSPWGFVASRYALTLGIMAVVVNRISHICRPQGRPRPLPTIRRLAIQIPTITFLAYSGLLLLLVTTHSFFPNNAGLMKLGSVLRVPQDTVTLINSATSTEEELHSANAALLWRLFLSVCFAVVSSTLLRTLEGNNNLIINPDDLGTSPTFNLVGFAVLLHLHASSYAFPPNKHVYLSILFQVGEVLGIQTCTCWVNRPPVSRLALTAFFGIISTLHYLLALRAGDRGYPFLQSFSRAPDVALIAIIALTVFLHALTAAITDTPLTFSRLIDPRSLPSSTDDYSLALFKIGTACLRSTRLSGMDSDLVDIHTGVETWVEVNGAQVVVKTPDGRIADSAYTADGRRGFSREIRKIKTSRSVANSGDRQSNPYLSSPKWREASKFGNMLMKTLRALAIIILRRFIAWLPFDLPTIPIPVWANDLPRKIRLLWHGTGGEERRRVRLEEARQRTEVQRQRAHSDQLFRERAELASRAFATSTAAESSSTNSNAANLMNRDSATSSSTSTTLTPWQKFFSQDFREDDDGDDDEWQDELAVGPLGGRSQSIDEDEEDDDDDDDKDDDDDDEEGEEEVIGADVGDVSSELLSLAQVDFEGDATGQETYTNVLMAHLSRQGDGALTRRGYQRLMGGQSRAEQEAQDLIDVIRHRRVSSNNNTSSTTDERERMRLCVICYIEDRTIICWPCKCLALCEGCREAMATRPPLRSHLDASTSQVCPTCRTPVVGFSRVYLP